jgi:opacity protein-like surface antigen
MKSLKLAALVLAVLVLLPVSSYAIVDAGVYGGYSLAALDTEAYTKDMNGWEYGFFGHITMGIPLLFSVGLGGFYQRADATVDFNGTDVDATRISYGIDVMGTIDLPVIPVNPFVRAGIAINESYELDAVGAEQQDKKFGSYYFAIGVGYSFIPMTKLFAEYVYNYSKQENDTTIQSNGFHIGAMLSI